MATDMTQASSSISDMSDTVPGMTKAAAKSLGEGDLVTGIIDITNMRAYMVPPVKDWDREKGNNDLEKHILSLQVIPQEYRDDWTLDHPSNAVWLSAALHHHYQPFATILIAPSLNSSKHIANALAQDNLRRKTVIESGKPDPGRSETTDWFKDADDEYELILLHHSHFLMNRCPLVVIHPVTERYTLFFASQDGFLREGSTTGPRLPPFRSRGPVQRSAPLNPILVNFSAEARLERLERQTPGWRRKLHPEADLILQGVLDLDQAVCWEPRHPIVPTSIKAPKVSRAPFTRERLMNLLEEVQDFQEIPDLV